MSRRWVRMPTFVSAADGAPVVLVPMQFHGQFAVVDCDDWQALIAAGMSYVWFLNSNGAGCTYVRTCRALDARTVISIAPMILKVGSHEQVTYKDGSRINLRRVNLETEPRQGGRRVPSVDN